MKKSFLLLRGNWATVMVVVVGLSVLSACKKDSMGNGANVPVAGLMAFNLTTDKANVGVDLSGNPVLGTSLGYTNFTGGYLNIYTGDRPVKSYNYYRDSVLATSNFTFDSSKYYSLFVVGNNGSYKNVVALDNFDSLASSSGKAYVRYINAIPDSAQFAVTANEAVLSQAPLSFGKVSEFIPVNTGDLNVVSKSNTGITKQRTLSVEAGKAYTVLLVGLPAATDSARTVQIKFVKNAG